MSENPKRQLPPLPPRQNRELPPLPSSSSKPKRELPPLPPRKSQANIVQPKIISIIDTNETEESSKETIQQIQANENIIPNIDMIDINSILNTSSENKHRSKPTDKLFINESFQLNQNEIKPSLSIPMDKINQQKQINYFKDRPQTVRVSPTHQNKKERSSLLDLSRSKSKEDLLKTSSSSVSETSTPRDIGTSGNSIEASPRNSFLKRRRIQMTMDWGENKKKIEELFQAEIHRVVFDSVLQSWGMEHNDFRVSIKNKKNLCIVIEDDKSNVFGGFIRKQIETNEYLDDMESCVFTLKYNNQFHPHIFPRRKSKKKDFIIGDNDNDWLFSFGGSQSKSEGIHHQDICIMKKDANKLSYTNRHSFEYENDTNPLFVDNRTFKVRRIIVYQLRLLNLEGGKEEELDEVDDYIPKKLITLTQKEVDYILFDSEKDDWKMGKSKFTEKIEEKSDICIVIQDTKNNIFGGFIHKPIQINKWQHDSSCFLFQIRKDGVYDAVRYELMEGRHDFKVCVDNHEVLFSFGGEDTRTKTVFKDICVYKSDYQMKSTCNQYSFDYGGIENALCGSTEFEIKKIIVYQMKAIEKLSRSTFEEIKKGILQITRMEIVERLFDSTKHKWDINHSEFGSRLVGRSNVCIVVEDVDGNIFGGFIAETIQLKKWISDGGTSIFTLRKKGELKTMKYPLKVDVEFDFMIFPDDHEALFVFGAEETEDGRVLRDLVCTKKEDACGYCKQYAFEYGGEENALLGKVNFDIKSIVVYQLVDRIIHPKMDYFEIAKRVKQLTGMNVSSVIFDSSKNSWALNDTSFKKRIDGKRNLCFIIETENDVTFGGFVGGKIKPGRWIKDPGTFLFSMKRDGIFELAKYPLNPDSYDFWLGETKEDVLFAFGGEDYENKKTQIFKDIVIHKKDSIYDNYCDQSLCFNYGHLENALIGRRELYVKRIIIYQLNPIQSF